eukprot:gene12874-17252_t
MEVERNKTNDYDMGSVILGEGVVTNLEFHREGRYLTMTTNESSLHLIDALSGEEKKKLYHKTLGINRMKYTHHESCILLSTEKRNNYDIKYLCLYDNKILHSFVGHSDKINSLSMSPIDDNFITSSTDNQILLWNLSNPNPIAKLSLPNIFDSSFVAFDESGVIFGILASNSKTKKPSLKLFDARNYQSGPFQEIVPENETLEKAYSTYNSNNSSQLSSKSKWNSFEFSTDGNHILVNTISDHVLILDSFTNASDPIIIPRKNDSNISNLGCCFSSNSKNVLVGNEDNDLLIYDKMSSELKSTLVGHVAPIGCIRHNPRYEEMASGCVNTVLWIPKI